MKRLTTSILIFIFVISITVSAQNIIQKKTHPSKIGIRQGVSFSVNGNGYIGLFDTADSSYFWKYLPATDTWVNIPNMPGPKQVTYASGFAIDNSFYVVGGANSSLKNLYRGVYEYNTINGKWTTKNVFPDSGRMFGFGVSVGSKGYFGLGTTSSTSDSGFDQYFYSYDPVLDHWTRLADFPGTPRSFAFAFTLNNKILVGGGLKTDYGQLNDLWEYDPIQNSWVLLNNSMNAFPNGISSTVAFTIQNEAYLVGGTLGNTSTFSKSIYTYDKVNKDFVASAENDLPITIGLGQACAFSLNDKGYVIGGWNNLNVWGYKNVYQFSPTTGLMESINNSRIEVYPNPFTDKIILNLNEIKGALSQIVITNFLGEEQIYSVNDIEEGKIKVDLSALKSGAYFMKIKSENGTYVRKVIKE